MYLALKIKTSNAFPGIQKSANELKPELHPLELDLELDRITSTENLLQFYFSNLMHP